MMLLTPLAIAIKPCDYLRHDNKKFQLANHPSVHAA